MEGASRRGFLQKTALGLGAGAAGLTAGAAALAATDRPGRLPREVWVATVSHEGLEADNPEGMVRNYLERMKPLEASAPDIVCLPEIFPFCQSGPRRPVKERAEKPIGPLSAPFADYAKRNNCYVICPIYTVDNGRYYNAGVVFDRNGEVLGEYRKIHPTISEIEYGLTPGPVEPPVFDTDFGKIGIQICYDIEWLDGWSRLSRAGAEIVFWPSAFAGGQKLNALAFLNRFHVVSSTQKDTCKICDVSGEEIGRTGRWNRWVCAPVNLEKAFLHTWPYIRRFNDVHAKYGRKVRITNLAEEEWTIIESRSPDVKVADVLKEFEMLTYRDHIGRAEIFQDKNRP